MKLLVEDVEETPVGRLRAALLPVANVEVGGEGDGFDRVLQVWLAYGRVINEYR